jgi:hypothetical protein
MFDVSSGQLTGDVGGLKDAGMNAGLNAGAVATKNLVSATENLMILGESPLQTCSVPPLFLTPAPVPSSCLASLSP